MQNNLFVLSAVTFVQRENHLCENAPNEIFGNKRAFIIRLSTSLNQFAEVPTFAVLHDKVD